ncbi:MAG: flagellar basal body rod protein FlgB [SAR324 cluster bacterium]|nr:flagellar basal body rod protein FlgB [SAR324 cluster bacterium]MCZ6533209.1 flagellar basal body rod protein FlgB [SAR324 cluster bacterium]MCZ6558620.1 flagellar basal body rod protein FlgB [SAR324 cluster bacterium]MCZ6628214.1 flagellar basal body rod protein FlgB [SAR324 cluster bacterium]MCZ6646734.1 flagellar basal body rod protein FlgB [SAR324 cluster bacterium]
MPKLFDVNFTLLGKSLDFRTRRNALLAGNIANLETPGYKSKDLVFERALGEAIKASQPGPLQVTHPQHMDGRRPIPLVRVQPQVIETASPDAALDQNTVNLETEMAKLAENQVMYQALTRMISSRFQQLKLAIREGDA